MIHIGVESSATVMHRHQEAIDRHLRAGRVLYSTYHTADNTHPGLLPQERILLYLIMEVGTCRGSKVF